MGATAIRICRNHETDIRGIVRSYPAARPIRQHCFGQVLDYLVLVPAVVGFLERQGIESSRDVGRRTPALEGLMTDKIARHDANFTRGGGARKSSSRPRRLLYIRCDCGGPAQVLDQELIGRRT